MILTALVGLAGVGPGCCTIGGRQDTSPTVMKEPLALHDHDGMIKDALKWLGVKPSVRDAVLAKMRGWTLADRHQRALAKKLLAVHSSRDLADFRQVTSSEHRGLVDCEPNYTRRGQLPYTLWYDLRQLKAGKLVTSDPSAGKFIATVEYIRPVHRTNRHTSEASPEYRLAFYHYNDSFQCLDRDESFIITPSGDSYLLVHRELTRE